MIVKYCNKCIGKPYTTDLGMEKCPRCGCSLAIKTVQEDDLVDFEELSGASSSSYSGNDYDFDKSGNGDIDVPHNIENTIDVEHSRPTNERNVVRSGDNVLRGKVAQYSSSGKEDGDYHRFFLVKLIDAIIYHQRLEDVLHRFKVRVPLGQDVLGNAISRDVWVNVHGTISGGAKIVDNTDVEVYGKFKNSVFMARKISVVDNGFKTSINFQHSVKAIIYCILSVVALIFMIYIGICSKGGFFQNFGSFFVTWLVITLILTVLYFIPTSPFYIVTLIAGKKPKVPIAILLIVSFVFSFLYFRFFKM